MTQERQLAAIMFTDIEGYTALMQKDEANAVAIRARLRSTFETTIEAFNGKVIQYFGDGTLSTFRSTIDAVECAIELQVVFLSEPKIPVRIGIHVGDIIHTEDDIIGDAVNVAARIESCAIPGSILISDKVHDQTRNHTHIKSKFLDAYELKNVEEAIPLFAIANDSLIVPKAEDIKGKLKVHNNKSEQVKSKKRITILVGVLIALLLLIFLHFQFNHKSIEINDYSIAVLPFENLSTDDDAEIFRDGMTEDILTHLSKIKELHVISRTSVMRYKKTNKSIPLIAEELGVSLILEGSIRKYGNKLRVTAQLIDAKTDEHIWAENYDRTLTDIFDIQSELSKEIVSALEINITVEEETYLAQIPTKNVEAYKLFLQGRKEADKRNAKSLAKSIELYEKAIGLDPKYAEAYAEIANSIYLETYYSARNPGEASQLANDYLDEAIKINDKVSRIYSVRGLIYNIKGKHDEAKTSFERAIKLSPNDVTARHQFSTFYYYTQQYEAQLEQAEIAYKLDPLSFATANTYFTALMSNSKYEEAEALMKKIEKEDLGYNKFVINRSFFRLYMDQNKYNEAIEPLKKMVPKENVFNRFLGFCYTKVGDTLSTYRIIDSIHKNSSDREKSHQLAVVYSSLEMTDSVLYHLDTIRNKQTRTLKREYEDFFRYLKDDQRFINALHKHGIKLNNN
ncbi:adenylate/guanylate cyclase domain-containing protein [Ichthyenterobacterium sp. W332]|uniref:Adenylate/guanylate cyclase domain-containing protein n=1 Tax=Microcosmobacter mediterraneus TaxID=3075607 RepID=A0ABU2YGV7_9FLAO|nr:adenylate/guanylate cyclase domain-containing protein [Ichthyenterobacterium sp. W332]MDT0557405.1 adenylate/guanylate cyclase domain-containing protein [Ichthyenterobacterium sp. W332]